MPYVAVAEDNSASIDLYYEDHGAGPAVVLVHGFPSSSRSWEKQMVELYRGGFRVVAYDRRGFGQSSMPGFGYDFDTLSSDLHALVSVLELRNVTLVGFGMGGGEVARYCGRYGTAQVKRTAFISSITPALVATANNPDGIDAATIARMESDVDADRFSFARRFLANTYNTNTVDRSNVSCDLFERDVQIAATISPIAMHDVIAAWREDFSNDLKRIDVPALVIHGDSDRIAPLSATAQRMPDYLNRSTLTVIPGAPHGLIWTHATHVNTALLHFLH